MNRNNPPFATTVLIVTMDAPRAPLVPGTSKVNKEGLCLVGINPQGLQEVVPCTVDCFKVAVGVSESGKRTKAPAHLRPENLRYLLRVGADKKAFRIDQVMEYDLTKLDKSEAPKTYSVQVMPDAYGTLNITALPHNVRLEESITLLELLSQKDKISAGDDVGAFTVSAVEGDTVKISRPAGEEEQSTARTRDFAL